ncbi:MAG: DUF4136 domain-containing protein [Balneolaceae bacterium]|nr:DUF4136 domain-containing protein [Balneolaceae bacterium]
MADNTFLTFFIGIAILAGCSPAKQTTDENTPRQINYTQYQTYTYGDAIIVSSENPAFSWPQFSERVKREINFVMPGKGLEKVSAQADVQIYFYAIVDANRDRPLLPYQIGWAAEPFITDGELFARYPGNTFVVDFVDSNNNQLIWRASTQLPYDNQTQLYNLLPERIHKLIQKYPLLP